MSSANLIKNIKSSSQKTIYSSNKKKSKNLIIIMPNGKQKFVAIGKCMEIVNMEKIVPLRMENLN